MLSSVYLFISLSALISVSLAGGTQVVNGVTVSNCPGAMVVEGTTATYCCVGATGFSISFCDGFPMCTSTSQDSAMSTSSPTITPPSCSTTIPLSATNFAQLVDSASKSLAAATAAAAGSVTGTVQQTGTSTSTGTSAQQTQNLGSELRMSGMGLLAALVGLALA